MRPYIGFALSFWALTAYASAAVPFAVVFFAAKGAEAGWKVAVIGLGGTGSYLLDALAKCPVAEIHLYDDDK